MGYLYLPVTVILIFLVVAPFYGVEVGYGGYYLWLLGPSSIYIIVHILLSIFLSIFNIYILLYSSILTLYLFILLFRLYRGFSKVSVGLRDRYIVIRDKEAGYTVDVVNGGGVSWSVLVDSVDGDCYELSLSPSSFRLVPIGRVALSFSIMGLKIGRYTPSISFRFIDSKGFLSARIYRDFSLIVRPRLVVSVKVAKRFLESYGGRGELEDIVSVEPVVEKGRVGLFHDVRPFMQGDEPRRIHFKKSAEHQTLIYKEYESSRYEVTLLLADLSVSTIEDLDEVLSGIVNLLLDYFIEGVGNVGMVMYDSDKVLYIFPPSNPLYLLKRVIGVIEEFSISPGGYSFVLDEPDIYRLVRSEDSLARVEFEILDSRFRDSVLHSVVSSLIGLVSQPSNIVLVVSNSILRNLYPMLRYILERYGHRILRYDELVRRSLEEYLLLV
jgi:uncharacterized protein (DUF58 family)